jgi:hypothetical protein
MRLWLSLYAALFAAGMLISRAEAPQDSSVAAYNEPGVIEGESLKPAAHPTLAGIYGHAPYPYSTLHDAPGVFSGDSELIWCTDGPPSREQMEVNVPVPRDGYYQVLVRLAKGPNCGVVTLVFDHICQPPIDCFAPKPGALDPIDLGTYDLTAGDHPLDFICAGASAGGQQFNLCYGLDYVKLVPISNPEPAHFRATGADDSSIHSITVGEPCPVKGSEGDTWDAAWTRQGSLYSPSNDTSGFYGGFNSNVAFNEITGNDPTKLDGKTINEMAEYGKGTQHGPDDCTWKSSGCMAIDGAIYWLVARHLYGGDGGPHIEHDKRQLAHDASFIMSTDLGKTWLRSAQDNYDHPMFPRSRFATPYFIQYGQDGHEAWADGSDKYVYALSNNGFWDNGDYVILGRCLRSKMPDLNGADWQFYSKGDGASDGAWTSNVYDAKPVLVNPDHLGMTRAVYLPKHQCYLMIGWYYPDGSGKIDTLPGKPEAHTHTNWDFYVAPHPWGPWRVVGSHTWTPMGYYCPGICPKFNSPDESTIWALTAGDWRNGDAYKLTTIPLFIK